MKILISENQLKLVVNLITEDDNSVKENVMFVGDSLSAGKGTTWNYLLEKAHPNWNVTHVVLGGMRTGWMLSNMLPKLKEKKYDKVFIYGGTNDAFWIGTNLSEAVTNIQKMVDAVNEQGGQAYVFLGYEAGSVMVDKYLKPTKYPDGRVLCDQNCMYKARERMIQLQKDLSSQIKNAIIIPTISGDDTWAPGDGTHVGPGPHRKMKDHVETYIKETKKTNQTQTTSNTNDDKKEKFKKFFEKYFEFLKTNEVIDQNSSDKKIRMMQVVLFLATKDNSIEINGILDGNTKVAINKFQKNNGLTESGIFDINTQDKLTQKIFKTYPGRQTKDVKKGSGDSEEAAGSLVITNPDVKVRNLPSNLEEQFKNIPGVDFNKFKTDVESIGIPIKYAVRQLFVESAFSPDVISCKRTSTSGARGLAQFMPTSWPAYGKGGDPCKPQDALPAYVRFMSTLTKRFPGRLDLVFAGYNSGPNLQYPKKSGNYVYDIALKNNTNFKNLKDKLSSETYAYVASILQP
jgi:peptidoglycan hydrolase-like protein with peptidoglycan-binding domain